MIAGFITAGLIANCKYTADNLTFNVTGNAPFLRVDGLANAI